MHDGGETPLSVVRHYRMDVTYSIMALYICGSPHLIIFYLLKNKKEGLRVEVSELDW